MLTVRATGDGKWRGHGGREGFSGEQRRIGDKTDRHAAEKRTRGNVRMGKFIWQSSVGRHFHESNGEKKV